MKKIPWIAIVLFTLIWACANTDEESSNTTTTTAKTDLGKKMYVKYCVRCHGAKGNMGLNGAKDIRDSQLNLLERISLIKNGKGAMNRFDNVLNDTQIEAVAKYSMTLEK